MNEYEKKLEAFGKEWKQRKLKKKEVESHQVIFTRKPATPETLEEWGKVSC